MNSIVPARNADLLQYLALLSGTVNEIEHLEARREQEYAQFAGEYKNAARPAPAWPFWMVGLVLIPAFVFMWFVILFSLGTPDAEGDRSGTGHAFWLGPVTGVLFGIVGPILNGSHVKRKNRRAQRFNQAKSAEIALRVKPQVDAIDARLAQLRAALEQQTQGQYPRDMAFSQAVNYLLWAIRSGRAETLGEALRLFDEQRRHEQMVGLSQEQIMAQHATTAAVNANTAAVRAAAARSTTVYIRR